MLIYSLRCLEIPPNCEYYVQGDKFGLFFQVPLYHFMSYNVNTFPHHQQQSKIAKYKYLYSIQFTEMK